MGGIQEFDPENGNGPYFLGGYDALVTALRTWRLHADEGIVGIPVSKDISSMLIQEQYDPSRAYKVADAALACVIETDIDKR